MNKVNYQLELDKIVSRLEGRPTLLLHSCCGPCSSYVLEYLTQYFEVYLSYYNPNIQPRSEYDKRLENQKLVLEHIPGVTLAECGYDGEAYNAAVAGLESEPEGGARCTECFRLRLDFAAREAARLECEYCCTTLSVSPHKDAQRINALGYEICAKYGVKWLPGDFKKRNGYKRSIELSNEYGLYRQDYCGCLYSKAR
ncbi:MAG TPA: epoxyqueuosine reductase QueH [Candidatus Scatomorpha gallistercoris]|nr:epoxyqueuosine reductase QueH [Candidatus Scatomorpha gallistercoris]